MSKCNCPLGYCLTNKKRSSFGKYEVNFVLLYIFYYRLQPVRDTREKQIQLWKELILDYCRTQKIFVIELEKDLPLFTNPTIESKLMIVVTVI